MRCRYCDIALAPSHSFVDGEFCCEDHRQRFELDQGLELEGADESEGAYASRVSKPISAVLEMLRRRFAPKSSVAREAVAADPESPAAVPSPELPGGVYEPPGPDGETEAVVQAESYAEGIEEDTAEAGEDRQHPGPHPARETAASWRWLNAAWRGAPRDLKLISALLPVLLVVAITGSVPKVPIPQLAPENLGQVQGQVQQVVIDHWKNLNQTISDRAAIEYADDFRSGLDAWESRSNLTRSWSYDVAGFVRPGPLAIFKPTVDLSDYRFEFLGQIDQKAMGWAFRAEDLNNYYAMKFVVVKPGPLPLVRIVRYAVINGKEGPHVDKPLPLSVRSDMLYRIQVTARGSDFTIMAQGQVVDFWTDDRLRRGGVGFFCNRGERARLSWVEVSHQYDALGRLCAYLAPYGIEGRNGNIN
jgi:hypothetical protein